MRPGPIDPESLMCALVLAPRTFSRNRFFSLYEDPLVRRAWRRAARIRGIVRQMSEDGGRASEIVGEQVLDDGRHLIRYRVAHLKFVRTTALSRLESALLRYALYRVLSQALDPADRRQVEEALARLGAGLTIAGEPIMPDPLLPNGCSRRP